MKSINEYMKEKVCEAKLEVPADLKEKVARFQFAIADLKKCRVWAQIDASKSDILAARKLYDEICAHAPLSGGYPASNLVAIDANAFMEAAWAPVWNAIKDPRVMYRSWKNKNLLKTLSWLVPAIEGM